jgi:hypothetical protein
MTSSGGEFEQLFENYQDRRRVSREIKATGSGSPTLRAKRLFQARSPAHLLKAQHSLDLEQDTIVKQVLSRPVTDYVMQEGRAWRWKR